VSALKVLAANKHVYEQRTSDASTWSSWPTCSIAWATPAVLAPAW